MEYIKLDHPEQIYAKKSLLYSEMEILSVIKKFQEFQKLRKLELNIKNALRKKIKEVRDEIAILDKMLPHIKNTNSEIEKIKAGYPKKRRDLESEIEDIRKKLQELH